MDFVKAEKNDVDNILQMYKDGADSLKQDGVDQWQDIKDRPNEKELLKIIDEVYVLRDGKAVSTCRIMNYDNQYDNIYEGKWLNNTDSYYAIHRVATLTEAKRKGYAATMMQEVEKLAKENNIKSIKIDTHHDNKKMQSFLKKSGYKYCGIIILNSGNKRDAFEKLLEP